MGTCGLALFSLSLISFIVATDSSGKRQLAVVYDKGKWDGTHTPSRSFVSVADERVVANLSDSDSDVCDLVASAQCLEARARHEEPCMGYVGRFEGSRSCSLDPAIPCYQRSRQSWQIRPREVFRSRIDGSSALRAAPRLRRHVPLSLFRTIVPVRRKRETDCVAHEHDARLESDRRGIRDDGEFAHGAKPRILLRLLLQHVARTRGKCDVLRFREL